jgi:NifU-like protein
VTEDTIREAIELSHLTTVEEVTNYTKAGGACGRCKSAIQALIDKYSKETEPKLSPAQLILKINKVVENVIAPELQKDGGDIELIDIDEYKVYVKLQGRCSSCKNSVLTIKSFVESTLRDKVSNKIEVIQV